MNKTQGANMEALLQVVEVSGVRMEAEAIILSENQEIVIETSDLKWDTSLQLDEGSKFITSGDFILDSETEHESCWRIELDPNYIDPNGDRYLSVYLILAKTHSENAVITASFEVKLPSNETTCYKKSAGLSKFSKEKPSYGFARYVPFSKLGPFANPNCTEKIELVVTLNIMKDVSEPYAEASSDSPSFLASTPPSEQLKYNASVIFQGEVIQVDSCRLSYYTPFFQKYLINNPKGHGAKKNHPDLAGEFDSKALLKKILEFCHKGATDFPKRNQGLSNLLKTATKLNIIQFKVQCQNEVLKRLDVNFFTDVVDLAREGFLDAKKAYPVIYEFMVQNIGDLEKNEAYRFAYNKNKKFYEELMLNCEDLDMKGDELDPMIAFYASLTLDE